MKASNTAPDGSGIASHDAFGAAVALSSDGSTLAVGARFESSAAIGIGGDQVDDSALDAGAVYLFSRVAVAWAQAAYVKASNTDGNDQFGWAIAVSSDASTLAIGAAGSCGSGSIGAMCGEASNASGINGAQTSNSAPGAGAVYLY